MIYIYRGLPGAGKNTHAREEFEADEIVDSDTFFMEDGEYQFDPERLTEAHARCFSWWLEAVEKYAEFPGTQRIALCNTNVTRAEYTPYVQAVRAAGFGPDLRLVHCKCSVETAIERNIHDVPADVIRDMAERWKAPKNHDPTQLVIHTENTE